MSGTRDPQDVAETLDPDVLPVFDDSAEYTLSEIEAEELEPNPEIDLRRLIAPGGDDPIENEAEAVAVVFAGSVRAKRVFGAQRCP